MNIQKVNNNSPSFGLKCPVKIKTKILDNIAESFLGRKTPTFFANAEKLATSVDNIGSDAVTLSRYKIKRIVFDDKCENSGAYDRCILIFKMKTPEGKSMKMEGYIHSGTYASVDIYRNFIKTEDLAERSFIDKYTLKMANKGLLFQKAEGLMRLYPKQIKYIEKKIAELDARNHLAETERKYSLWGQIKHFYDCFMHQ